MTIGTKKNATIGKSRAIPTNLPSFYVAVYGDRGSVMVRHICLFKTYLCLYVCSCIKILSKAYSAIYTYAEVLLMIGLCIHKKRSQCFIYCDPYVVTALYLRRYDLIDSYRCIYPIDTKKALRV